MKKLFYYYFTEYFIKKVIILFLRLKGIKIGNKIIVLTSGHSNKIDRTDLKKGIVYGFHIVWASEPIKKDGKFIEIKPPLYGKILAPKDAPRPPP